MTITFDRFGSAAVLADPDHAQPGHSDPVDQRATRSFRVIDGGVSMASRLVRFLGTTLAVTVVIGLVGGLVLHAKIIERQHDLDERNRQIATLEVEAQILSLELAQLEAPARIVREAKTLGMIEAPAVVYLQGSPAELDDRVLRVASAQLRGSQ